jgi:hypothetical protein
MNLRKVVFICISKREDTYTNTHKYGPCCHAMFGMAEKRPFAHFAAAL